MESSEVYSRESDCWWTRESPMPKFYGRLWLICSVLRALTFSLFGNDWYCNFLGLLHHPFRLQLVFTTFLITSLSWWGFSTRNASMVHIVNQIWSKMMYTSLLKSLFVLFKYYFEVYSCKGRLKLLCEPNLGNPSIMIVELQSESYHSFSILVLFMVVGIQ